MIRKIVLVAAVAIGSTALGACASQNGSQAVAQVAPPQTAAQSQKLVCLQQAPIGSHISKSMCMTQEQYKEKKKADAAERARMQQQEQQQMPNTNQNGGPPR